MKICPVCGGIFEDSTTTCPIDGHVFESKPGEITKPAIEETKPVTEVTEPVVTIEKKKKWPIVLVIVLIICILAGIFFGIRSGFLGMAIGIPNEDETKASQDPISNVVSIPQKGKVEETGAATEEYTEEETVILDTEQRSSTDTTTALYEYDTSYTVMVYETYNTGLALKSAPGLNAGRYLYIPENTSLVIDQIDNGWGHTYYNGLTGWVALKYTRVMGEYQAEAPTGGYIEPTAYVVTNTYTEGLELRLSPTEHSSTFGPMMDGAVFIVEAYSGQWAYGRYNNIYGWAYSGYLKKYE